MKWKVLLIMMAVNHCYIILGGVVFYSLEKGQEEGNRVDIQEGVVRFLSEHDCVSRENLDGIIEMVVTAYSQGILASDNVSSSSNWDPASAVFFSGTVVTTIGYGNLSPSTNGGKAFCGFYAILGIPLMMVMLAGIGERLNQIVASMDHGIMAIKSRPKHDKALRCGIIFSVGAAIFLFVPSAVFSKVEGWSYETSLYYAVITLTTIGFGDYVAGANQEKSLSRDIYRVCLCIYVTIGLAWLATVLAAIQDFIGCFVTKVEERIHNKLDSLGEHHGLTHLENQDLDSSPASWKLDPEDGLRVII